MKLQHTYQRLQKVSQTKHKHTQVYEDVQHISKHNKQVWDTLRGTQIY